MHFTGTSAPLGQSVIDPPGTLGTAGTPERPDIYGRWTPHPVIVTIIDNKDYVRVLLYSYYTTIAGWGVLLIYMGDIGIMEKKMETPASTSCQGTT